jgi:RND family efflux transporter MFP subunit
MSLWKQLVVTLVIIIVAAGAWLRFVPSAPAVLESAGLGWVASFAPERSAEVKAPSHGGFQQQPANVVAAPIGYATINDRLSAIGTGRALNSVQVTPFATGRLTEILVGSGAHVERGDIIARLDSEGEEISLDRARIALKDAEARMQRVAALRTSNTVTAVQVTEAELSVSNAQLAVRDAELSLNRRSVAAPISGIIGIIPVSAGNYVTSQTEIATIDDRSSLVIDFWVPERFATVLSVGQAVTAASIARPDETVLGTVSAVDSRVDAQSRTLHVQARIDNSADVLRAGMSFQVSMTFPGDSYPSVNPLAIQWGTEGAYVWLVEEGRTRRAPISIIQRNTDSVLVSGDFGQAGSVVTEGLHAVREGAEVRLVRGPDDQSQSTVTTTGS